jgi:hypothetical protein
MYLIKKCGVTRKDFYEERVAAPHVLTFSVYIVLHMLYTGAVDEV